MASSRGKPDGCSGDGLVGLAATGAAGGRTAVPFEGGITPDRSARNRTAAGKSTLFTRMTSSAASPPTAQVQHRQLFRVKSTWKLGWLSS